MTSTGLQTNPSERLVLGIDGGGTKTVAWLARSITASDVEILGRGRAGPGNPRANGFPVVFENIDQAIQQAFEDASYERREVAAIAIGLAGAGRPDEQQQVTEWAIARGIARRVRVMGDAEPILAAGRRDHTGVALISGTGSFAWGRNWAGATARSGGWGYLMGDEGSGYAIAIAGLRAAGQAADERGPSTKLLPRFQTYFGVIHASDLIGKIHAQEMSRDELAKLAGEVFAIAEIDAVARNIINAAGIDLASMVQSTGKQLALNANEYCLALSGGVLLHQPQLREATLLQLAHCDFSPAQVELVPEPTLGAVRLALEMIR